MYGDGDEVFARLEEVASWETGVLLETKRGVATDHLGSAVVDPLHLSVFDKFVGFLVQSVYLVEF